VSAPMCHHRKTTAPMGNQTTWAEDPIRAHPNHRAARAQSQRRGGADLCVRSVVPWSEDTRPNGQPNHVGRKPPLHPSQRHRETNRAPTPTKFVPSWGILPDPSECPGKVKKSLGWKGGLGGSRVVLCPLGRGASDEWPAGGHRGPRSRHPGFGPWRTVCSEGRPAETGQGGSRVVLCPSGRGLRMNAHWSGHRGPRSRHPGFGSWGTVCLEGRPAETGAGWIQGCSLPIGAGVFRRMPSGRTRRSALPPSCIWAMAHGVFGGTPSGRVAGPMQVCSLPIGAGVSDECPVGGHRGPRSLHPVSRPWRTVCLDRRPSDRGPGPTHHPPPVTRHPPPAFGGPFAVARHPTSGYHQRRSMYPAVSVVGPPEQ
jgi:hypothetical protein